MIEIKECRFESFSVIGLVGDNSAGPRYVDELWRAMNVQGKAVMHLAKKDDDGQIMGAWGLMNDETLSFLPPGKKTEKTVYLAGIEVDNAAKAPKGFTKWTVPASDYLYAQVGRNKLDVINAVLQYAGENGWEISGCPFDFMPPDSRGEMFMFFPVKKL